MNKLSVHQMVREDAVGTAYGYRVKTTHLLTELMKWYTFTKCAQVNLCFVPPVEFERASRGSSWLITTVENDQLTPLQVEKISQADVVVVPSEWCRNVISSYVDTVPCFVVPHGVDPVFTYKERSLPPSKYHRFRYLYVGAKSPRKGVDQLIWLWDAIGFRKRWDVELYLKLNMEEDEEMYGHRYNIDNVIVDGRNLSMDDLVEVYHDAHCFVLPTRGEGFSLTLAEAMRTGLPCVATDWSGHLDFFDEEVGYPVEPFRVKMDSRLARTWCLGEEELAISKEERELLPFTMPQADQLAGAMILVAQQYKEALKKGKRAHERIAKKYTWENSGKLFRRLLVNLHDDEMEISYGGG